MRQHLSEYVSDIVMTGDMPNGEGTILNMLADKVMMDIDVLALGMVGRVQ